MKILQTGYAGAGAAIVEDSGGSNLVGEFFQLGDGQ